MKKPSINNLIAKVQGRNLTTRQSADATRELNQNILYTEELELLLVSGVNQRREMLIKCLIEWECCNEPSDIKSFEEWIDKRPHLINCD